MLTPDRTFNINGVKLNEKIIPDSMVWTDATKAKNCGQYKGKRYKANRKLCGTGKPTSVTIHNTGDLANVYDDGEQYTRATFNQNMNTSRVHFYVDDTGAWQNLKAGLGLSSADPVGSAEVGWHAGDDSLSKGGNATSIAMEIIMNESTAHDEIAYDNGARLAAWLLVHYNLPISKLVTHTYWVNNLAGKKFSDVDKQCTNKVSGKKWCPTYILGSTSQAYNNWKAFKSRVESYMKQIKNPTPAPTESPANFSCKVTATDGLNRRKTPDTNGVKIDTLKYGTVIHIIKISSNNWGFDGVGWVSLAYTQKIEEDDKMLSYEEFKAYMEKYRAELQAKPASAWSQADLQWAVNVGLMQGGDSNGNLMPLDNLTREQAAALFHRYHDKFNV